MRNVRWLVALLACGVAAASSPADTLRAEYAYAAQLQLAGGGPAYQLGLPLHVYRNTVSPERADLRVVNADDEVVPYALLGAELPGAPREPRRLTLPFYPLRGDAAQGVAALRLAVRAADGSVVVASGGAHRARQLIGYLFDARQLEAAVSGWSLQWEQPRADFDVTVWLHCSDDLLHWEPAAVSVLADLHQGERRFVRNTLGVAPRRARYWRLSWDAPSAPLALRTVTVELQDNAAAPRREVLAANAAALGAPPGEFRVAVPGWLPIDRVNVRLPVANSVAVAHIASRRAASEPWRAVVRLDLYRVAPAAGAAAEIRNADALIGVNTDPLWQVRIEPAEAVGGAAGLLLDLAWQPRALVFLARGRAPFTLLYGNAQARSAAVPADTLLAGARAGNGGPPGLSAASLGAPVFAGGVARLTLPPPPLPWKRWVLWGVLLIGTLLLLAMAWRLAR